MAATSSPVVPLLQDVLGLRSQAGLVLSNDILERIQGIKEKCRQAELKETTAPIPWRRSMPPGNHGGNQTPHKSLPQKWRGGHPPRQTPHTPHATVPRGPHQKYVSKFQNTDTPVEDKILNTVILNKLNKFSESNYDEIKGFLQQILDDDASEFLKAFMLLIFKKAATENTFCPLYARMIAELSAQYTVLQTELKELYKKYIDIFEEVSEEQCKDYETFVQRNREKQLRLGYSQFLAELTRLGALELSDLEILYSKIMTQVYTFAKQGDTKTLVIDEYLDCLLKMSQAFHTGNSPKLLAIRNGLSEVCVPKLTELYSQRSTNFTGISKRASFTILDCLDSFKTSD